MMKCRHNGGVLESALVVGTFRVETYLCYVPGVRTQALWWELIVPTHRVVVKIKCLNTYRKLLEDCLD